MQQRSLPKGSFVTVPNFYLCGGVKDFHVLHGAWVTGANPNPRRIFLLEPRPTKTESRGELIQMHHPRPPSLFERHTVCQLTLHFALVVVSFTDQRKARSILLMNCNVPRRDNKQGQVICGLRGYDRLDKSSAADHGNIFPGPTWKLSSALVFKVLEVYPFKLTH
jgi:hypothetical protein